MSLRIRLRGRPDQSHGHKAQNEHVAPSVNPRPPRAAEVCLQQLREECRFNGYSRAQKQIFPKGPRPCELLPAKHGLPRRLLARHELLRRLPHDEGVAGIRGREINRSEERVQLFTPRSVIIALAFFAFVFDAALIVQRDVCRCCRRMPWNRVGRVLIGCTDPLRKKTPKTLQDSQHAQTTDRAGRGDFGGCRRMRWGRSVGRLLRGRACERQPHRLRCSLARLPGYRRREVLEPRTTW